MRRYVAFMLLYLLTACVTGCSGLQNWKYLPESKADERPVYIVNHGWHTGIVIAREDLIDKFGFLNEFLREYPFYEFGWGEEAFYQAEKITAGLALKALFLKNPSVMHVVGVPKPPDLFFANSDVVQLHLSKTGTGHLVRSIFESFKTGPDNRPVALKKGLYGNSFFFKAHGSYFITNTCNAWTAEMLENGGVPVDAVLTLRAGSVMNQVRAAKKRYVCCPR